MSGINFLIDTLLPQVLGKRADTPPPQDVNQPVKPIAPADAPRALHSDSRLDARAPAAPLTEVGRGLRESPRAPAGAPNAGAPASTEIHFTPSARTIADLLLRFPAPPSTVRLPQPLVAAGESASPLQVAERLQGSVRDSGLFYESHLARWFRGQMPREQLLREPQMWRTQTFTPATPAAARETLAPLTTNLPFKGQVSTAEPAPAAAAAEASRQVAAVREPLAESLQGIVRHQLEMVAMPVLRWEGDVWSGVFMALVIHLPQDAREQRDSREDTDGREGEGAPDWRSEMTLEVAGLGEVGVDLWLRGTRLDLDLRTGSAAVQQALEQGRERLEPRLAACGLADVRVRIRQDDAKASA